MTEKRTFIDLFVMPSESADYLVYCSAFIGNFAVFIEGEPVVLFRDCIELKRRWLGDDPLRVSPPAPEGLEPGRNCFLVLLVEVFAEIRAGTHGPWDEIGIVTVDLEMLFLTIPGDFMPFAGQGFVVPLVVLNIREEMEMRAAASLKLSDPNVLEARE